MIMYYVLCGKTWRKIHQFKSTTKPKFIVYALDLFLQAENSNSATPPAGVLAVTKDNRVDGRVTLKVSSHCGHFVLNRMAFHRFLLFLKDGNTVSVVDSVLVKESTRQYEDCRDSLPAGVCYTLLTNNPVRRYKRTNHRPPSFDTCKTGWSLSYLRRARCKTSVEGPSWSSSRRTAEPPATSAAATPTSPTHSARPSYVYQRLISKSYVIV